MQRVALQVDELLSRLQSSDDFSGCVLLSNEDKIIIHKAYGLANREHNVLNTTDTKFRIGSITKQFTAMAIMILEENKVLSVNDSLKNFTPFYKYAAQITIHHLLTHTSGIPNITQIPNFRNIMRQPTTLKETTDLCLDLNLEFAPGSTFKYTNSGYILLAYIIEQTTGLAYEDFLSRYIFEPLTMLDTGCDNHKEIISNRAQGYEFESSMINADYINMAISTGGGNLYSTTGDLYRWDRALNSKRLVSKESFEKIYNPYDYGYGYGWFITNGNKGRQLFHGGGIVGFKNIITRLIDERMTLIILNNLASVDVNQLSEKIIQIAI